MKNYYEILEVNETASEETINKVYKFLAKKFHPDTNPDNKELAEAKFKEISEAYEILSSSEKRSVYDAELKAFKESQNPSINYEDYENLKNYCLELEYKIQLFNQERNNNFNANNTNQNNQAGTTNRNSYENNYSNFSQEAFDRAVEQAYNDAYYATLRNHGYKIRYKKTFKDYFKGFISLVLTTAIISIILYVCWQIPSIRNYLKDLLFFLD